MEAVVPGSAEFLFDLGRGFATNVGNVEALELVVDRKGQTATSTATMTLTGPFFLITHRLGESFLHGASRKGLCHGKGVGELGGVFAAGLGHLGATAAAAAGDLGGFADPVAGLEAFGDQIIADGGDEVDLCRRRTPSRIA